MRTLKAIWEEDNTPIEVFAEICHEAITRTIGLLVIYAHLKFLLNGKLQEEMEDK